MLLVRELVLTEQSSDLQDHKLASIGPDQLPMEASLLPRFDSDHLIKRNCPLTTGDENRH